jgi:MATE family multidrug resistance protein
MPQHPPSALSGIGSRSLTHRRVLGIALPIVLSNATVPILGAVDTGVIGQMGSAVAIGGVGIGAVIISAVYWIFGFLRMGTTGLAAQALGARDNVELSAILSRALFVGFLGGIALILLHLPLFSLAFRLSPASPEVETLAREYLAIRIWATPFAIALFGITGWLIAQERTRAVLVIQVWMNGLNAALDLLFVLGLGWGVPGVAVATAMAEISGFALGLWFCREALRGWARPNLAVILDRGRLSVMASVNGDILIRSLLLESIFVSFMFQGAGIGTTELAANQILLQFLNITAYALDGFAFAAEALVGQAMGARARVALRRAALMTGLWGGIVAGALALVFLMAGPSIIDVMTTAGEVRGEAREYLAWMVVAPLVGIAPWMLDGIFIGATRTRDMRNMMALSTVIYFATMPYLSMAYGNHGLWMALLASFVARGVTLGLRYPALERAAAR